MGSIPDRGGFDPNTPQNYDHQTQKQKNNRVTNLPLQNSDFGFSDNDQSAAQIIAPFIDNRNKTQGNGDNFFLAHSPKQNNYHPVTLRDIEPKNIAKTSVKS